MEWVREGLVDGYELQSILGRGSHGEVYRALQQSTGQIVAVKILRIRTSLHSPPRSVQVERFRREIMACAALQHPNVVRAMDAGTTRDGQLYSVFEYVPGPTLRAVLSEHRALPVTRLREFMLQTLDALASAHSNGIIHRDFKPENIVVSTTGVKPNFKVLDFGVSALLDGSDPTDSPRITGTGEALGTPAYAAPEQLRGEAPTSRTDLYAWGLVSLECITGQQAVRGLSIAEVHYRQLLPDEINLPPELARHPLGELLRWVLCKQTERRASDASAVYAKLERISFDTLVDEVGYLSSDSFPPAVTHPTPSEVAALHAPGERRLMSALCLRFRLPRRDGTTTSQTPTALAGSLDNLLQEQRRRSEQAIARAGGQLVSFSGSRALAVFGFPHANEADARNAALCAMEIDRDVALQNHALPESLPIKLIVSGGLHTGLVSLHGDELTADRVAGLVLAEASDLADRAQPGEILVSAASDLSVRGDLELEPAGEVDLTTSGLQQPALRLLGSRDPFAEPSALGSLLGRARELAELERHFERAAERHGICIWIEGDAGIGKSALLRHFRAKVASQGTQLVQARCLKEERRTALHPVLDLVRRQLGLRGLSPADAALELDQQLSRLGLAPEKLGPLLRPWLSLPLSQSRPPAFAPQRIRELSLQAFTEVVLATLGTEPSIFVLEDAHWCDATTREWLETFRSAARPWPVLVLITSRPGADPRTKAACAPDTDIVLAGIADADARSLITELAGDATLDPELTTAMIHRADGVPLFLQELTRYVKSHRIVSTAALEIPTNLRELLAARLDQLGAVRVTAQAAAVIGREFDLGLLQRISSRDNTTLLGDVEQLVSAGLVETQRRVGQPTYRFRHALLQAAAYDALLSVSRKQLHERVARALESDSETLANTAAQELARHWAEAGDDEKALGYAKRASMELLMRSSHVDLIEHSRVALGWVERFPEGPDRVQHELDLMLPYVLALMSVRGYAEEAVAKVVERVEGLLAGVPEYGGAFNLYFAIGMYHNAKGTDRVRALQASERLVTLVETCPEYAALNVFAWTGIANCLYVDGEFVKAQRYVERVRAAYDKTVHAPMAWQFGFDPLIATLAVTVVMHWISGDLDKCEAELRETLAYAERLGHPESLAQVVLAGCIIGYCRRDREQTATMSHRLAAITEEHRLNLYAPVARVFAAHVNNDIAGALAAVETLRSARQGLAMSFYPLVLSDLELTAGNTTAALAHTDDGIAHAESSGERSWYPRLLCQRALIARRLGNPLQATEAALDQAINEARERGMLMYEIEATIARRTLMLNEPISVWEGSAQALSRQQVTSALERIREGTLPFNVSTNSRLPRSSIGRPPP